MASSEAPRLSGVFGEPDPLISTANPDNLILGDRTVVAFEGDWRPEELRVVNHPSGSAAVIYGDCLTDEQTINKALDQALTGNNPVELTNLEGSYTTLLLQPDKLTVLGDLAGQYPFFHRRCGDLLEFASVTKPLRDSMASPLPDASTLAARIAIPAPAELLVGRSATEGIDRLEAGHMLTADRNGSVRISPYETFQVPSVTTIEEAASALREAILQAVGCYARLGYCMSADFSGGYDSTSGAYCLAQQLNKPLLVVTCHSPDLLSDDLEYARRYRELPESKGLFDARELAWPAADMIYGDLLNASAGDEPDFSIVHRARDERYYRFLRSCGSELHISGSGADAILDLDPKLYLNGLAHIRTLGRFILSTVEAARVNLQSPLELVREVRARSKIDPSTNLRLLSQILEGGRTPELLLHGARIFGSSVDPYWLTPKARRDLSQLALSRSDEVAIDDQYDQGNYHAYLGIRALGQSLHGSMQYASEFGLRKRALYLNNAVLRACLSLPAHLRVNPWTFKEILGRALDGLVPNEVTSRSTKDNYSRHGLVGLKKLWQDIEYLRQNSRLAELGIIEPRAIKDTLDRIQMGGAVPSHSLEQFVAIERWLGTNDGGRSASISGTKASPRSENKLLEPSLPIGSRYGMPADVLLVTRPNGAIALNIPRGSYHRLNTDAVVVVRALQEGNVLSEALTILESLYPKVASSEINDSTNRVIRELIKQGVLSEDLDTFSITEGAPGENRPTIVMTRQNRESTRTRLRDYPAALGGLVIALFLKKHLPLTGQLDNLTKLHRPGGLASRWSTESDAAYLKATVEKLSEFWLGRAACWEATMGTVFAGALKLKRIDLGLYIIRTNPDEFHAIPEVRGTPIRTARESEVEGVPTPILSR